MNSPVFDKLLYSNEDRKPCILPIEFPLHDDPPEAFGWLLEYMYRGEPDLPSVPMALEVSVLATKYQMGALKAACSEVRIRFSSKHFLLLWLLCFISSSYFLTVSTHEDNDI